VLRRRIFDRLAGDDFDVDVGATDLRAGDPFLCRITCVSPSFKLRWRMSITFTTFCRDGTVAAALGLTCAFFSRNIDTSVVRYRSSRSAGSKSARIFSTMCSARSTPRQLQPRNVSEVFGLPADFVGVPQCGAAQS
jgi:hypothetical protein